MKEDQRKALIAALRRPRYEVIPLRGIEEKVLERIPKDIKLTVTASPAKGIDATLRLAGSLGAAGYDVVPHLSARQIADESHLKDVVERLHELGVREVFVIAGDAKVPAGRFEGALDLLVAMDEMGHGFDEIGITGYPESHPFIDDDVTIQSMWDKRHFATYIVSNVCFDPRVISRWIGRVRRRGVDLPIFIGMPGVTERKRLLSISTKIGVGESTRFLVRHRHWFLRLLLPGGYSAERLLRRLVDVLADPERRVPGVHVYTFNEVGRTERWRLSMLERVDAEKGRHLPLTKELRR